MAAGRSCLPAVRMASIQDTVKALGKEVNCPVHTAPLTKGLINKPGEVMDVARLQAAGKEPSEGEGDERGRDGAEGTGGWRSGGLPGSAESL